MAKKKYTVTPTPTPVATNPKHDMVRDLRSKGFDDNRIAAMVGISSLEVKDIK